MRPRDRASAPRHRLRAALLVLLVAPFAAVAGCFDGGDEPPLAQPTTSPVSIPSRPVPATPTVVFNFSDPGYVMNGSWRVGDGWDYESNRSSYRKMRVVDSRVVGDRTDFLVEETFGIIGNAPRSRTSVWVDGGNWTRLNETDFLGTSVVYQPGQPLRYHKNGTFGYNETAYSPRGVAVEKREVAATSRLVGRQTLLFPWGYVEAAKVEHRMVTREGEALSRTLVTRWVHRDYLNDVRIHVDGGDGGEVFVLVAAQVGDLRRGSLRST